MFEGESTRRIPIPQAFDSDARSLLATQTADRIRSAEGEFKLSPEARQLYEEFYHAFYDRTGSDVVLDLTERAHIHVIKIALTFAVLDGHHEIEYGDLERAIEVVSLSIKVATSIAPELGLSKVGRLESKIVAYLQRGACSMRDLYRNLNISAKECQQAIQTLIDAQAVDERYGKYSLR